MKIDDFGNISFRQSWLDTANRCPNAGRLAALYPDDNVPSYPTALGTAAHAGMEARLTGISNPNDIHDIIGETLDTELAIPGIKQVKYEGGRPELLRRAIHCYNEWATHLYPKLPEGVPEVHFDLPVFTMPDGRTVSITGTIDFVPYEGNLLWDWKCPGRTYSAKEKQNWAIQPTIYTMAAVMGGLKHATDWEYEWPMSFGYGIMVTQVKKAKLQTFTVTRQRGHASWAMSMMYDWVVMYDKMGFGDPWPKNESTFLCTSTWCDSWDRCKGAHQDWKDNITPVEFKDYPYNQG